MYFWENFQIQALLGAFIAKESLPEELVILEYE